MMRLLSLLSVLAMCGLGVAPAQTVAERYLLAAANADRATLQLKPLRLDEHLVLAARLHAYEMARRGTISHQFPGEAGLASRGGAAGAHFSLITENVAEAPNSAQIHDLWMQSAGHRANLLDPAVDSVGIAVVQQHGQYFAVEDFGRLVPQLSLEEQESRVAGLVAQQGVQVQTGSAVVRQTCTMSTGHAGARTPWFVMRYTAADLSRLPDELQKRLASGRYREAEVGACTTGSQTPFSSFSVAVLLYP